MNATELRIYLHGRVVVTLADNSYVAGWFSSLDFDIAIVGGHPIPFANIVNIEAVL